MGRKNTQGFIYWFWHKKKDKDVQIMLFIPIGIVLIVTLGGIFYTYPSMNPSTWYYSISTIIQSLAAILAVGGAFFTFKMLGVKKEIDDYRNRMISFIVKVKNNKSSNLYSFSDKDLREKFLESIESYELRLSGADTEDYIEFFKVFEKRFLPPELQKEALNNWVRILDDHVEIKKDTTNFLKESFKLVGSTIVMSSFILLFSDLLVDREYLSYILLAILFSMFSISIYYMATKIVTIVK